jgi:uncharacterized membrane protein YccC
MLRLRQATRSEALSGVADSVVLAIACLVTYWLTVHILALIYQVSRDDDTLGGLWAVIATIFVFRDSYSQSMSAAVSRMSASLVSFVLCLAYLAIFPFRAWGLAVMIGLSALAVVLIGRPGDAITAAITTTVILVVASFSPRNDWQQPILRFADTVIGVAVGVIGAWLMLRVIRPRLPRERDAKSRGT